MSSAMTKIHHVSLQKFCAAKPARTCPAIQQCTSVPVFATEITGRHPMRGQREPALRMVCRAQTVKFPDCARQNAVVELLALAPPAIPNATQITVRALLRAGQFHRQQAADAEQTRLQCKRRGRAARPNADGIRRDFASARRCVCSRALETVLPIAPAPNPPAVRGREIARPWPENERAPPGQKFRQLRSA